MKANSFIVKNKKAILISGGLLVAGIIAYILLKKGKAKDDLIAETGTDKPLGISWPLRRKLGALTSPQEKEVIANVQRYLNRKISYVDPKLVVDGIFGPETEKQVKLFLGVSEITYKLYTEIIGGN